MTTYSSSAVSNTVIAYEKPITLQQGRALRDNLLATAEGDATAPRIQPAAYAQYIDEISHVSTTVDVLSLAYTAKYLRADVFITKGASGSGVPDFRVRASSDGGATWGAYRTLLTVGIASTSYQFAGVLWINVETGAYRLVGTDGGAPSRGINTIAVLAGTNAFEFSFDSSTGTPTGSHLFAYMGHGT